MPPRGSGSGKDTTRTSVVDCQAGAKGAANCTEYANGKKTTYSYDDNTRRELRFEQRTGNAQQRKDAEEFRDYNMAKPGGDYNSRVQGKDTKTGKTRVAYGKVQRRPLDELSSTENGQVIINRVKPTVVKGGKAPKLPPSIIESRTTCGTKGSTRTCVVSDGAGKVTKIDKFNTNDIFGQQAACTAGDETSCGRILAMSVGGDELKVRDGRKTVGLHAGLAPKIVLTAPPGGDGEVCGRYAGPEFHCQSFSAGKPVGDQRALFSFKVDDRSKFSIACGAECLAWQRGSKLPRSLPMQYTRPQIAALGASCDKSFNGNTCITYRALGDRINPANRAVRTGVAWDTRFEKSTLTPTTVFTNRTIASGWVQTTRNPDGSRTEQVVLPGQTDKSWIAGNDPGALRYSRADGGVDVTAAPTRTFSGGDGKSGYMKWTDTYADGRSVSYTGIDNGMGMRRYTRTSNGDTKIWETHNAGQVLTPTNLNALGVPNQGIRFYSDISPTGEVVGVVAGVRPKVSSVEMGAGLGLGPDGKPEKRQVTDGWFEMNGRRMPGALGDDGTIFLNNDGPDQVPFDIVQKLRDGRVALPVGNSPGQQPGMVAFSPNESVERVYGPTQGFQVPDLRPVVELAGRAAKKTLALVDPIRRQQTPLGVAWGHAEDGLVDGLVSKGKIAAVITRDGLQVANDMPAGLLFGTATEMYNTAKYQPLRWVPVALPFGVRNVTWPGVKAPPGRDGEDRWERQARLFPVTGGFMLDVRNTGDKFKPVVMDAARGYIRSLSGDRSGMDPSTWDWSKVVNGDKSKSYVGYRDHPVQAFLADTAIPQLFLPGPKGARVAGVGRPASVAEHTLHMDALAAVDRLPGGLKVAPSGVRLDPLLKVEGIYDALPRTPVTLPRIVHRPRLVIRGLDDPVAPVARPTHIDGLAGRADLPGGLRVAPPSVRLSTTVKGSFSTLPVLSRESIRVFAPKEWTVGAAGGRRFGVVSLKPFESALPGDAGRGMFAGDRPITGSNALEQAGSRRALPAGLARGLRTAGNVLASAALVAATHLFGHLPEAGITEGAWRPGVSRVHAPAEAKGIDGGARGPRSESVQKAGDPRPGSPRSPDLELSPARTAGSGGRCRGLAPLQDSGLGHQAPAGLGSLGRGRGRSRHRDSGIRVPPALGRRTCAVGGEERALVDDAGPVGREAVEDRGWREDVRVGHGSRSRVRGERPWRCRRRCPHAGRDPVAARSHRATAGYRRSVRRCDRPRRDGRRAREAG